MFQQFEESEIMVIYLTALHMLSHSADVRGRGGIWWISLRRLLKWLEISTGLWYPLSKPESPWYCTFRKGFLNCFHHLRLRRPPAKSNRLKFSFISHDEKHFNRPNLNNFLLIQSHLYLYIYEHIYSKTVSERHISHKINLMKVYSWPWRQLNNLHLKHHPLRNHKMWLKTSEYSICFLSTSL